MRKLQVGHTVIIIQIRFEQNQLYLTTIIDILITDLDAVKHSVFYHYKTDGGSRKSFSVVDV